MVTGIEAAGLVLGTFPLAIEAIKIYCNGVQTVKDMVKYQEILSMFQYEISVEDFFFRQTLKSLLEENLPKSDIERLMNDPGGELWKSVNIQAGLQELLQGDEAVNHFLKTATLLRETLQDVARKFDKPRGIVCTTFPKTALAWKTGMGATYRKETIKQIQTLNGKLRQFINAPRQINSASFIRDPPENVSKATLTKAVQHYKLIQEHATTLDKILQENLQPPVRTCTSQHHAHLQLELRSASVSKTQVELSSGDPKVLFKVMFSVKDLRRQPDRWKELELEHVDPPASPLSRMEAVENKYPPKESDPPRLSRSKHLVIPKRKVEKSVSWSLPHLTDGSNVKIKSGDYNSVPVAGSVDGEDVYAKSTAIDCFCTTIQHSTDHDTAGCVGILTTKANTTLQIRVWTCTHRLRSHDVDSTQIVSLESLLATPKPPLKSRMLLALKLASCVMQLHSTPWLAEFWSASDIWFPTFNGSIKGSILQYPLVHRTISQTGGSPTPTVAQNFQNSLWKVLAPNMSLLALGIVLIELLEWKTLAALQGEHCPTPPLDSSMDQSLNRLVAAKEMVKHLVTQLADSDLYFHALRRCIDGLDHPVKTLDRDGFKSEVYKLVVRPLEVHFAQGWPDCAGLIQASWE